MKIHIVFNVDFVPSDVRSTIDDIVNELEQMGHEVSPEIGHSGYYNVATAIDSVDAVIAMVDFLSPAIMFELGYAFGLGKPIVIMGAHPMEMPMELSNLPFISVAGHGAKALSQLRDALGAIDPIPRIHLPIGASLREMIDLHDHDPIEFDRIPPKEFERAVRDAFEQAGASVVSDDVIAYEYGFDFLIVGFEYYDRVLVEVKKHKLAARTSIREVQKLLGAVTGYDASHGILIAASGASDAASDFASRRSDLIEVWDLDDVRRHLDVL